MKAKINPRRRRDGGPKISCQRARKLHKALKKNKENKKTERTRTSLLRKGLGNILCRQSKFSVGLRRGGKAVGKLGDTANLFQCVCVVDSDTQITADKMKKESWNYERPALHPLSGCKSLACRHFIEMKCLTVGKCEKINEKWRLEGALIAG